MFLETLLELFEYVIVFENMIGRLFLLELLVFSLSLTSFLEMLFILLVTWLDLKLLQKYIYTKSYSLVLK